MHCVDARRRGFSLAELLVTLTLTGLIATLLFATLHAQVRLARTLSQRILGADAVRTASTVLGGELRRIVPADVRGVAPDSLALRAFRGAGIACDTAPTGLIVAYRGDRQPDPQKDSVVWLTGAAHELRAALVSTTSHTSAACVVHTGADIQLWRTQPPLAGRGVGLVFENGKYYLSTRALRYRLGAEGRQPLTAELFAHPATGFVPGAGSTIRYRLAVTGSAQSPMMFGAHFPDTAQAP